MELAVDRLTKQYKNKIAVDRVSFSFQEDIRPAGGEWGWENNIYEDALWDFGMSRRRGGI